MLTIRSALDKTDIASLEIRLDNLAATLVTRDTEIRRLKQQLTTCLDQLSSIQGILANGN